MTDPTPTATYDPSRLRSIIRRTGRSLRDIATEVGTDPTALSRISNGLREPGADLLARILAACKASWRDLE